jgi:hypothetical protein
MKFNCGLTRYEKRALKEEWHKKFLWFPKRMEDGYCHWLEFIERKGLYVNGIYDDWWHFSYRLLEKKK